MPITPYHIGPSALLGHSSSKIIDFPTLLVASVLPDIEPFVVLLFNLSYPSHGFFHGFLGGTVLALLTALPMYVFRYRMKDIMATLNLPHNSSFKVIFLSALLGIYFHVILDAFTHGSMKPFYPFESNPFLGVFSSIQVELFCIFGFVAAIVLYLIRWVQLRRPS